MVNDDRSDEPDFSDFTNLDEKAEVLKCEVLSAIKSAKPKNVLIALRLRDYS